MGRKHVTLCRQIGLLLLPLDLTGAGVDRRDQNPLGRKHPGGTIGRIADDDDAGTHRPARDDTRVARDAVVPRAEECLPNQRATFRVETVGMAVIGADIYAALGNRRSQAHRPLSEVGPALLAGGGGEAVNLVVSRRAVIEQTIDDDRVVGVVEDLP